MNRLLIWILGIVLISGIARGAQAQTEQAVRRHIDSLAQLSEELEGRELVEAKLEMAYLSEQIDMEGAVRYSSEAYNLARIFEDTLLMAKAKNYLALEYKSMDQYKKAVESYLDAIQLSEAAGNTLETAKYYNNYGNFLVIYGSIAKALENYTKALELKREINDSLSLYLTLNNVAITYQTLDEFDEAENYLVEAYQISNSFVQKTQLRQAFIEHHIQLLTILAFNTIKQRNYSDANRYLNEAEELLAEDSTFSIEVLAQVYHKRGTYYKGIKEFQEAEISYKNALESSIKTSNRLNSQIILIDLANLYVQTDQTRKGLDLLTDNWPIFEGNKTYEYIHALQALSKLYQKSGQTDKALEYLVQYTQLKDSIKADEMREVKDFFVGESEKIIRRQEQTLEQNRRVIILFSVVIILISALILVVYRSNRAKTLANTKLKEANQQLEEAKQIIEEKNEELSYINNYQEELIKDRTQELRLTNQSLKETNDELDHFIYKSSHDLRGPIARMKGMVHLGGIEAQESIIKKYFSLLGSETLEMEIVLDRLMLIHNIYQHKVAAAQVDVSEAISSVLKRIQKTKMQDVHYEVSVPQSLKYKTDPYLMELLIENLLENAINHKSDDPLLVSLWADSMKDGSLLLKVSDNGIPIPEQYRDQVFDMFFRVSSNGFKTGLELNIVKKASKRLGGEARFLYHEKHTTFEVAIPPLNGSNGQPVESGVSV